MKRMVMANDASVGSLLESMRLDRSKPSRVRYYGSVFGILSASYCNPGSAYYRHPDVAGAIEGIMKEIRALQNQDGTINSGNIESPPDTAFLIESIGAATFILRRNNSQAIQNVLREAESFLLKAGEALVTGRIIGDHGFAETGSAPGHVHYQLLPPLPVHVRFHRKQLFCCCGEVH